MKTQTVYKVVSVLKNGKLASFNINDPQRDGQQPLHWFQVYYKAGKVTRPRSACATSPLFAFSFPNPDCSRTQLWECEASVIRVTDEWYMGNSAVAFSSAPTKQDINQFWARELKTLPAQPQSIGVALCRWIKLVKRIS